MRVMIAALLAAALLGAGVQAGSGAFPPALDSLIEAERAFAPAAVQKGIRDSFLEYFDDDALALTPETTAAASAESGDLGYSYGLYHERGQPPERGAYVACKRATRAGAGGSWRR
jgi:hypothetical protein